MTELGDNQSNKSWRTNNSQTKQDDMFRNANADNDI